MERCEIGALFCSADPEGVGHLCHLGNCHSQPEAHFRPCRKAVLSGFGHTRVVAIVAKAEFYAMLP
jgi:hypothetical protein